MRNCCCCRCDFEARSKDDGRVCHVCLDHSLLWKEARMHSRFGIELYIRKYSKRAGKRLKSASCSSAQLSCCCGVLVHRERPVPRGGFYPPYFLRPARNNYAYHYKRDYTSKHVLTRSSGPTTTSEPTSPPNSVHHRDLAMMPHATCLQVSAHHLH